MLFHGVEQLGGVILRDVLSGKEDRREFLLFVQEFERIDHGFEHGLGAEVRTADADADYHVGLGAEFRSLFFDGGDVGLRDRRGEADPTQEIVSGAFARMQQGVCSLCLGLDVGREGDTRFGNV